MMKKLLAILLCIALMLPGVAEEAGIDGVRLTIDGISVTIGEETFAPDLSVCLDEAATDEGALGSFFVMLNGNKLLPAQVKLLAEGLAVKLGNSSVYCFAPEMLGVEGMEEFAQTDAAIPSAADIAYGFVEYLDTFEEDSFELEPLELLAWLEGMLELDAGSLRQLIEIVELPYVTADRDDMLGYTIAVGNGEPMYITLRVSEQMVTASSAGLKLVVSADGGIQGNLTNGYEYSDYSYSDITTLQYQPNADGSSTYSFKSNFQEEYRDEMYSALSGGTRLLVSGGSDAQGVHNVKITYIEEYEGIDDIRADLHLSIAPAQVSDGIAGETPVMIESEEDSSASSILFAAMGLFSDVERLMNDASVAGIINAYNAQCDAYNEIYWQEYEDYAYYSASFDTPEFGWMPEGAQLEEVTVTDDGDGVSYVYSIGETAVLYINMTTVEEDSAELTYTADENSFNAVIVEDGVGTCIYSDDIVLTEAEVLQILDGRIWVGSGYDDTTNKSM